MSELKHIVATYDDWVDITGYDGVYQASSGGMIRRMYKNGKYKILMVSHGYFSLSKNSLVT